MFFFKKKNKEEKVQDNSRFKVVDSFDLKPFSDLKYDLIYAHNEIILENGDVTIGVRQYKGVLLKFMLVSNFDNMDKYSLETDCIIEYANQKGYYEYIKPEDLDCYKDVQIYIFKETTEKIKQYAFINATATNLTYRQYFTYDHDNGRILQYRKLRDFGPLVEQYLTALFFDLACVDKEMY